MYLWLKAFHVIVVIAWMAGLLYLPRLFVYHAGVLPRSPESTLLKVMERRLLRYIVTPSLILVWLTGLGLAGWSGFYKAGWLHAKIALVVALSAVHGVLAARLRRFASDSNTNSQRYYRILNEIPTVLMILIVILVVVKPF
jgi:putative membrane protein